MTDEVTKPEITAEDMRVLLVALDMLGETLSDGRFWLVNASHYKYESAAFWADNAHKNPYIVLACLRFIDDPKTLRVHKIYAVTLSNYFDSETGETEKEHGRVATIVIPDPRPELSFEENENRVCVFTDPDPAVRIVKAAIAVARELEGGK